MKVFRKFFIHLKKLLSIVRKQLKLKKITQVACVYRIYTLYFFFKKNSLNNFLDLSFLSILFIYRNNTRIKEHNYN